MALQQSSPNHRLFLRKRQSINTDNNANTDANNDRMMKTKDGLNRDAPSRESPRKGRFLRRMFRNRRRSLGNESLGSSNHETTASTSSTPRSSNEEAEGENGIALEDSSFQVLREESRYSNWKKILSRIVRMPNGSEVDFEVIDQKGVGAVLVFAWNTTEKTATLIREYNPGCNGVLYGLAGGLIEADKHGPIPPTQPPKEHVGPPHHDCRDVAQFDAMAAAAAQAELEEEANLRGGQWFPLLDPGVSVPIEKYFCSQAVPFLVMDAQPISAQDAGERDAEEFIEIHRGIPATQVRQLIASGQMSALASWTCLLALEKLKELGEIQ